MGKCKNHKTGTFSFFKDVKIRPFYFFFPILGLFAFVLVHWVTAQRIGVNPGFVAYIDTAKNLLCGNRYMFSDKDLKSKFDLQVLFETGQGIIYGNDK